MINRTVEFKYEDKTLQGTIVGEYLTWERPYPTSIVPLTKYFIMINKQLYKVKAEDITNILNWK